MQILLIAAAALIVIVLILRHKFQRDGIYQNGARVGSALLGSAIGRAGAETRFVIVRGQIRGDAVFREEEPFLHRGAVFRIVAVAARDDRSTVLLRLLEVTCQVEDRGSA